MAWEAPKTNWYGATGTDGQYVGDRFNAVDFNRIKNNLTYLYELSIKLYKNFSVVSLGNDRTPASYIYADEFNQIEENLNTINVNTLNRAYGSTPVYEDNGNIFDFWELKRIESASLDLYNRLSNEFEGRRTFTWNLGTRGGEL